MAREGDGMNGRCPHCQRDLVAVAPLVEPIVDQRPWIDQVDPFPGSVRAHDPDVARGVVGGSLDPGNRSSVRPPSQGDEGGMRPFQYESLASVRIHNVEIACGAFLVRERDPAPRRW
jgi:hypothetical protein